MRYVVINPQNKVRNIIELEAGAPWAPPANHNVMQSDTLSIGDVYEGEE